MVVLKHIHAQKNTGFGHDGIDCVGAPIQPKVVGYDKSKKVMASTRARHMIQRECTRGGLEITVLYALVYSVPLGP